MNTFKVADLNIIIERHNDPEFKEFFIQAHCEIVDESNPKGGEAFIVNIVSPLYLKAYIGDSVEIGRGLILSNDFDKEKIKSRIQILINKSNASTWNELSTFIEKYFDWV
jgi:hypothetical protein